MNNLLSYCGLVVDAKIRASDEDLPVPKQVQFRSKFSDYSQKIKIKFNVCIVRFITGGRSVMAHILSPWSKDLFHRAIVQSGAITDLRNLIPSHPPEYYARQVCPFIATFMATNLGVP